MITNRSVLHWTVSSIKVCGDIQLYSTPATNNLKHDFNWSAAATLTIIELLCCRLRSAKVHQPVVWSSFIKAATSWQQNIFIWQKRTEFSGSYCIYTLNLYSSQSLLYISEYSFFLWGPHQWLQVKNLILHLLASVLLLIFMLDRLSASPHLLKLNMPITHCLLEYPHHLALQSNVFKIIIGHTLASWSKALL